VAPLLEEKLFLIRSSRPSEGERLAGPISISQLKEIPLILPTMAHGLRSLLDAAFARAGIKPVVVAEIDSLAMLMDAVDNGLGATIQPRAAVGRFPDAVERFDLAEIDDIQVRHLNSLCSLSDDELSSAALGTRLVLMNCVSELVQTGRWTDARLIDHN
jgi:LysR family tcuABC transcriptional regulator